MNEGLDTHKKLHWYQKTWGIILVFFIILILASSLAFGAMVFNFYWKITHGQGEALQSYFNNTNSSYLVEGGNKVDITGLNRPYMGMVDAPIEMVVFLDYKCPYCKEYSQIISQVISNYPSKVKVVFRHFPVESLYAGTNNITKLVECSYNQGKYYLAFKYFYENQDTIPKTIDLDFIGEYALNLNLNKSELENCYVSSQINLLINRDYADGIKYGVEGTPTTFINGVRAEGVLPFDSLKDYLSKI